MKRICYLLCMMSLLLSCGQAGKLYLPTPAAQVTSTDGNNT